ncbi:MAG: hypothetical protein ACPGD5_04790 [Salibacteraceae bacterium]
MIDLSYPYWYLGLCSIIAGISAWGLYFFQKSNLTKTYQYTLSFSRFLLVFVICVLILKPIIKYGTTFNQKPIIVIGIDNSKSVLLSKDSVDYKTSINDKIVSLKKQFGDKFEVKTLLIGESTTDNKTLDFTEQSTNISSFISYINDYYSYDNLASVYLISDGIINKGTNPIYQKWNPGVPLNTIGIGDSTLLLDQRVIGVRSNSVSFLGNKIPVKIDIGANAMKGKRAYLVIQAFGNKPILDTIPILSNEFSKELSYLLEATTVGRQKIVVKLLHEKGEVNVANNTKTIYVNVKDKKQKVLLVYDYPSPDINAIRTSLEKQDGLELTLLKSSEVLALTDTEISKKYSVAVAFQIPSNSNNSIQCFNKLNSSSLPIWFVGSNKTNYIKWFASDASLSWQGKMNNTNDVRGGVNNNFSLFTTNSNSEVENTWSPVKVPFGVMKYSAGAQVLVQQKVGGIETQDPLWIFTVNPDKGRRSYFLGDGIWRWKIGEYQKNENWNFFDELVGKTIQVLAQKKDDSRFKIRLKSNYFETEDINVGAEFFNLSYEPINTPAIRFVLVDTNELESEFELDKIDGGYSYKLGTLAKGRYAYKSTVKFEGKSFTASGSFEVLPMQIEHENLRADFNLLTNLAVKNGGEFYTFDQWGGLIANLNSIEAVSRSYEEIENKDLIHQKWLFALLIILVAIEWLLRKREGVI